MNGRKLWMKHSFSRALALLLCFALLLAAAGCGRGQEEGDSSGSAQSGGSGASAAETGETVSGRYVENKRSVPDTSGYLWSLNLIDGVLYQQGSEGFWKSEDRGDTWEPWTLESPMADQIESGGEGYYRGDVIFGNDGTRIVTLYKSVEEENSFYTEYRYVVIDKDGGERELEIRLPVRELYSFPGMEYTPGPRADDPDAYASQLTSLLILPDGSLAGLGMSQTLYHVDQNTGEVLHTFEPKNSSDFTTGLAATPKCLLLTTSTSARLFDLETWEEREDNAAINEFILGNGEVGEDGHVRYVGGESRRYIQLFADGKEEAFYFVDSNGLYRYIPGGVSIEQLMEAPMSVLTMQDTQCMDFVETEDHSFLVLFQTRGESWEDFTYSFYSYDYDPDAIVKPPEELKIYSLYPTESLNQAIAVFQRDHKDILLTYESGINWEAGTTNVSDALRQLNTEIMADKGPDVLVLDGMPIDNYQSKGLMADITDVVEEVAAENDLLRNITDVYAVDGKIYSVPASFMMPIVVGDKAILDKITGIDSLAQTVRELRDADREIKSITGYRLPAGILRATIGMLSPGWLQDGVVDWDIVGSYYDQMKIIYDADNNTETEGIKGAGTEDDPMIIEGAIYQETSIGLGIPLGESAIELREMQNYKGLCTLYGVQDDHPEITYKVLEDDGVCGFDPTVILGVNARSGHHEEAKAFIKMMLEQDMQSYITSQSDYLITGLPVNFNVVRNRFASMAGKTFTESYFSGGMYDFTEIEVTKRYPTSEEVDEFYAMTQKLNRVSPNQENMVNDALLTNCAAYLDEGVLRQAYTREEALQKAKDEIDLYLAES